MAETLHKVLSNWDGKDTRFLERLFHDEAGNPGFLKSLVTLSAREESQRGATWLLKHHFDIRAQPLSPELSQEHIACVADTEDWQTRLHVLQYLEHLDLPVAFRKPASDFVEVSIRSERPFVRAWAWHALSVLAQRFPDQRDETCQRLSEAQETETAGSVKVRIRKALARLNG